jgi:hypothetical protein
MTVRSPHVGAQHLRRLARAHSAGEMSTAEYRRRRRAFIEACAQSEPGWSDDATVPRIRLAPATSTAVPPVDAEPGRIRDRRVWLWAMPLAVVLLVILRTDLLG